MTTDNIEKNNEETVEIQAVDEYEYETQDKIENSQPLKLEGDRKLITQPYDYSIRQIVNEVKNNQINLSISYQRKYVWDTGKASRLIESLLLNVPIPVLYLAENDDYTFEVIDGLQRITSLKDFLEDNFKLTGLSVLSEIEGKKFSELQPQDQRRLSNRTIRCIAITQESHPDIKFDVFERLNTNVAVLTAQEIRNCVLRGHFNDSAKELSSDPNLELIVGNTGVRRMVPEELVIRFFSLIDGVENYAPPLNQFINKYMRSRQNRALSDNEVKHFKKTLSTTIEVFGETSLKSFDKHGKAKRTVHKALFDAVMVSVATMDQDLLIEKSKKDDFSKTITDILHTPELQDSIGKATADTSRVYSRIRIISNAIEANTGIRPAILDILEEKEEKD